MQRLSWNWIYPQIVLIKSSLLLLLEKNGFHKQSILRDQAPINPRVSLCSGPEPTDRCCSRQNTELSTFLKRVCGGLDQLLNERFPIHQVRMNWVARASPAWRFEEHHAPRPPGPWARGATYKTITGPAGLSHPHLPSQWESTLKSSWLCDAVTLQFFLRGIVHQSMGICWRPLLSRTVCFLGRMREGLWN